MPCPVLNHDFLLICGKELEAPNHAYVWCCYCSCWCCIINCIVVEESSLNLRSTSHESLGMMMAMSTTTLNPQKQRFFFTVWFINADSTEPTSLSFHTTIHKCPHLKPQICLLSPFSRLLYLLKLIFQLPQCHGCWEFNATPSMPPPLYPYFLLSCWALPSLKLPTLNSLSFSLSLFVLYINSNTSQHVHPYMVLTSSPFIDHCQSLPAFLQLI